MRRCRFIFHRLQLRRGPDMQGDCIVDVVVGARAAERWTPASEANRVPPMPASSMEFRAGVAPIQGRA